MMARRESAARDDETRDDDALWLNDREQRVWRAHLAVNRLLTHRLTRDLQVHGLTVGDYEILVNLSETSGRRMRMTELADQTLLSKSRLSHQVTRLEKSDLVRRENCDSDGRGMHAVLTEHGFTTLRAVAPYHVRSVRENFIDRLTPEQLQQLEDVLEPLADYLASVSDVRG